MDKVNDTEHCSSRLNDIGDFWKGDDLHLVILRHDSTAPVTLTFDTRNKRNTYFDALVAAIAAYSPPT